MRRWPRGVLVVLVVSASGCAEMIINTLTRPARFERACLPATQYRAFGDDPAPGYRAYEGPTVERQQVAVVVVPLECYSSA